MKFPWSKKSQGETALPAEVQKYYQAEKRQRMGVASLLAVGTLILTVAVALGIFFGGRWTWRHVIHKPHSTTTAVVQAPDDKTSSKTTQPSTSSQPATNSTTSNTQSNTTGTATTTANPSSTSMTNGTPTNVSGAASNIPNTGPSSILPVIIGTFILGVIVAEGYQRRAHLK